MVLIIKRDHKNYLLLCVSCIWSLVIQSIKSMKTWQNVRVFILNSNHSFSWKKNSLTSNGNSSVLVNHSIQFELLFQTQLENFTWNFRLHTSVFVNRLTHYSQKFYPQVLINSNLTKSRSKYVNFATVCCKYLNVEKQDSWFNGFVLLNLLILHVLKPHLALHHLHLAFRHVGVTGSARFWSWIMQTEKIKK